MNIEIEWHNDQFNVNLSSKPGKDAFLSIKGCRIVNGSKGDFVSYPARKNEQTGKYWNHVWASDEFNRVVLEKAAASMPASKQAPAPRKQREQDRQADREDFDADIPFANPLRGVRALVQ